MKICLYYNKSDLKVCQNVQRTYLFADGNIAGFAIYNLVFINDPNFDQVDIEDSTFFLGSSISYNDSIFFKIALSGKSVNNVLNPGIYKFGISGGTGKFINASGTVTFEVDEEGNRNITIHVYNMN